MPPINRTEAEESNLLDDIFAELDGGAPVPAPHPPRRQSAATWVPPPRTPERAKKVTAFPRHTPSRKHAYLSPVKRERALHVAENVDIDSLIAGAEDWDWDDMNSDFMTPRKSSPVIPKVRTLFSLWSTTLIESTAL